MPDNKEDIKKRLRQARLHLGLSSTDFAKKAGTNANNYSSIETGGRTIGPRLLKDIASAHGLNISWLNTGEGPMMAGDIHISGNPHHIGNIGGAGNTAHMTINAWGYQKIIRENYIELVPLDSGEKGTPVSAEEMVKEYNATQLELAAAKRDIERKDKIIRQYEALIDRQAALVEKAKK